MSQDNADDLPYRAEYAKSGRASCKGCKGNIGKETLRLATMTQSPFFDGKQASWYHFSCFFTKQRPKTVADIAHFESLRFEDQEKISAKIGGGASGDAASLKTKAGKAAAKAAAKDALKDFETEYAKSGAAKCRKCGEKILKNEVRCGKKVFDSERARAYGPYMGWHHVACFVAEREALEWFEGGESLPGFKTLSKDDQHMLRDKIKKVAPKRSGADAVDGPASKKVKSEPGTANGNGASTSAAPQQPDKEQMRKQSQLIFKYRDQLRKLEKPDLQALLEFNSQDVPPGVETMLDRLADSMAFGALETCSVCKNGQFVFRSGVGYQCQGDMTEWTKCTNIEREPKRIKFKVPKDLAEEHAFLRSYKCKLGHRLMAELGQSTVAKKQEIINGTPLLKMTFVVVAEDVPEEINVRIQRMGGKLGKSVTAKTAALICSKETLEQGHKFVKQAEKHGVQVIPPECIEQMKAGQVFTTIETSNLASWGDALEGRLGGKEEHVSKSGSSGARFQKKSGSSTQRVRVKQGGAVDPESGLEDQAHVYQTDADRYTAVLSKVDLSSGANSYYRLQVLQSDTGNRAWLFRAWGRLGTTVGGTKLEEYDTVMGAVREFRTQYEDKTGNPWANRQHAEKQPGKYYPQDIDYGDGEEAVQQLSSANSKSLLPKPVQELVCMLFDVKTMRAAMVEFDIDLEKMPLGKLSQKQMRQAFSILTEAQTLVEARLAKGGDEKEAERKAIDAKLLDCSNRFFTLIPHDFGMDKPPLLDNLEIIKSKADMVESLMEIEVAYSILRSDSAEATNVDPLDLHYRKLNSEISVLQRDDATFALIQSYITNTHAKTHSNYTLELEQVFCVKRQGEHARYRPFSKLHNRKLLWHGSRLANFGGIISQGLRIAPPEAPATGYMFGKGVYFADMVSKSANYCFASHGNPRGLLLLCEVALGNMYERKSAEYVTKLPTGKHSTKGIGKTHPDPAQAHVTEKKVEIPLGKGISSGEKQTSLLYNEYIVYDVAQVNIQYLLQVKFNFQY